ncbi:SEM3A protein, partial [Polypterus senegalus]
MIDKQVEHRQVHKGHLGRRFHMVIGALRLRTCENAIRPRTNGTWTGNITGQSGWGALRKTLTFVRTQCFQSRLIGLVTKGWVQVQASFRTCACLPELTVGQGLRKYELDRSCCFSTLLLDEERGRLFVGGKNYLLSLSLDNISKQEHKIYWPAPVEWREECNWAGKDINDDCVNYVKILHHYNRTHLYACGTGAFHPTCGFVEVGQRMEDHVFRLDPAKVEDGKGKSPYDPKHQTASVLIEPKFINAFWIPESDNPDDDKIFFFFRETAVEGQSLGKTSFARIAQLCRCPSKTFGSFESTKGFPDDVIQFARHHPLMYSPVYPLNKRPIFIRSNVDYSFTQITVDRVTAADGQYDVMFIGTDIGSVLKVISVPKESWKNMEELVLEEMQVFKNPTPIINLQISSKRQQLYVGSEAGLAQVPLHRCSSYGKACAECCLARDPYCAWDGTSCTRYLPNTKRRFRRQDVRNGDPNTLCSGDHQKNLVTEKKLYGVEGSSTFLECIPKSLQAQVTWTYQSNPEQRRVELHPDERLIKTDRGLLLRTVMRRDMGIYHCHAMEHGFTQTLLRITLDVIPSGQLEGLHRKEHLDPRGSSQKLWYRDFLQLVDHPTLNSVDEICEQVWKRKNRQTKLKPPEPPMPMVVHSKANKWKHLQEVRKNRNRRTHEGKKTDRAPRSTSIW